MFRRILDFFPDIIINILQFLSFSLKFELNVCLSFVIYYHKRVIWLEQVGTPRRTSWSPLLDEKTPAASPNHLACYVIAHSINRTLRRIPCSINHILQHSVDTPRDPPKKQYKNIGHGVLRFTFWIPGPLLVQDVPKMMRTNKMNTECVPNNLFGGLYPFLSFALRNQEDSSEYLNPRLPATDTEQGWG